MVQAQCTVKRSEFKREQLPDDIGQYDDTLGKYINEYQAGAIDRQERGDMRRGEFRYFLPAMSGEDTGNPDSPEQDYQRAEALNRGEWCYVGIRASVRLSIPVGNGTSILQTISTPGLWGIESDSDQEYIDSVFKEECDTLVTMLQVLNVSVVD